MRRLSTVFPRLFDKQRTKLRMSGEKDPESSQSSNLESPPAPVSVSLEVVEHNEQVESSRGDLTRQEECALGLWSVIDGLAHWTIAQPQLAELLSLSSQEVHRCDTCALLVNTLHCFYPDQQQLLESVTIHTSTLQFRVYFRDERRNGEIIELFAAGNRGGIQTSDTLYGRPIRARVPLDGTDSQYSVEWTLRWLEKCTREHPTCVKDSLSSLPTRIIDLAPNGDFQMQSAVRLVEGKSSSPGQYAALSYCWGKSVPECILTQSTLDERMQNIPFGSLPKTFQDAVRFSRALGVRYLWIDSLCIVQDDEADWRHESALMDQVYGNSLVTLAAVRAKDCHDGLSVTRAAKDVPHLVQNIIHGGRLLQIFAQRDLYCHEVHNWRKHTKSPLFDRAWAYQERLMAPRVVYFTDKELLWGCFVSSSCECLWEIRDMGNFPPFYPKKRHKRSLNQTDVQQRWLDIIQEYSKLELTKGEDKLLAVSAVARQIHQYRPGDRYLAGLWYDTLIHELRWYRDSKHPPVVPRSRTYIASTWSWASIREGVSIDSFFGETTCDQPVAILSAHCDSIMDDQYGQVTSGSLVIEGTVLKASLSRSKSAIVVRHNLFGKVECLPRSDPKCVHTFYPDCLLDSNDNGIHDTKQTTTVYLLRLWHHAYGMECLVLVKLHNRDVHHRIGMTRMNFSGRNSTAEKLLVPITQAFESESRTAITIE